jgi:hypothetical protein
MSNENIGGFDETFHEALGSPGLGSAGAKPEQPKSEPTAAPIKEPTPGPTGTPVLAPTSDQTPAADVTPIVTTAEADKPASEGNK